MSDHLDRLMRKVDMLEQDNKRLFDRLARLEKQIAELKPKGYSPAPGETTIVPGFLDD